MDLSIKIDGIWLSNPHLEMLRHQILTTTLAYTKSIVKDLLISHVNLAWIKALIVSIIHTLKHIWMNLKQIYIH